MNAADVLWTEHKAEQRERQEARKAWRQAGADEAKFRDSQAPMRRKDALRCESCGRHWGCNCYPLDPHEFDWMDS